MIGITGGVGCGKSTVLNLIKENFNAFIIMAKLASVIFSNPNKRIVLNSIIHPVVKKEIVSMITQAKIDNKYDYIFVEAALLLDDHYNVFCDETWYIYADEETRRERLKSSRGYSDEKIDSVFASQLSDEQFRSHCSRVIDNSHDEQMTLGQLKEIIGYYD